MLRKPWNKLSSAQKSAVRWFAVIFPLVIMAAFWLIFRETFTLRAVLNTLLTGLVALALYGVLVFFLLVLFSRKNRPREQP